MNTAPVQASEQALITVTRDLKRFEPECVVKLLATVDRVFEQIDKPRDNWRIEAEDKESNGQREKKKRGEKERETSSTVVHRKQAFRVRAEAGTMGRKKAPKAT